MFRYNRERLPESKEFAALIASLKELKNTLQTKSVLSASDIAAVQSELDPYVLSEMAKAQRKEAELRASRAVTAWFQARDLKEFVEAHAGIPSHEGIPYFILPKYFKYAVQTFGLKEKEWRIDDLTGKWAHKTTMEVFNRERLPKMWSAKQERIRADVVSYRDAAGLEFLGGVLDLLLARGMLKDVVGLVVGLGRKGAVKLTAEELRAAVRGAEKVAGRRAGAVGVSTTLREGKAVLSAIGRGEFHPITTAASNAVKKTVLEKLGPKVLGLQEEAGVLVSQGGKALTKDELLNLSRMWKSEVTQVELKNGGVAIIRGKPGTTYFGDYRPSEILRHTHTHPGGLNLFISDLDINAAMNAMRSGGNVDLTIIAGQELQGAVRAVPVTFTGAEIKYLNSLSGPAREAAVRTLTNTKIQAALSP